MTRSASRAASSTEPAYSSRRKAASASGGSDLAEFHGLVEIGADFGLRLAQGVGKQVFEDGAISAERGGMGDAPPHDAGADDSNRLDPAHLLLRLFQVGDGRIDRAARRA